MKKAILITLLVFFSVVCMGQNEGALKFLGIPIDGTETQFAAKLRGKGFTYNSTYESYKGQLNGKSVDVYIHTNHNLVDRVYVAFPYTSEEGIRVEFNKLLSQFKDNGKYMDLSMNTEIPSGEDISYEISVNKKRYQASFSYFDPDRDPLELMNALLDKFDEFFTPEQIAEFKASIKKTMEAPSNMHGWNEITCRRRCMVHDSRKLRQIQHWFVLRQSSQPSPRRGSLSITLTSVGVSFYYQNGVGQESSADAVATSPTFPI